MKMFSATLPYKKVSFDDDLYDDFIVDLLDRRLARKKT